MASAIDVDRPPSEGHGFVYVLSNRSMPGVYKVGITANRLRQRIQQLSTTGVPIPFELEHVFEVPEIHLRAIEQRAHQKLRAKDMHYGKEFFEGAKQDCLVGVQDAIFEVTSIRSIDLIGLAEQRALEVEEKRKAELLQQKENELRARELTDRQKEADREVDSLRYQYVLEYKYSDRHRDAHSLTRKPQWILFLIAVPPISVWLTEVFGLFALAAFPVCYWWFFDLNEKHKMRQLEREAATAFPYKSVLGD